MLKYPAVLGTATAPSGVFIGDSHADLRHLVQLTASISELINMGINVLFVEAFYADAPPVSTDVASLGSYISDRNFNHFDPKERPVGHREVAIAYHALLQRCRRDNLPVVGIDAAMPDDFLAGSPGFKRKIFWRTGGVNAEWKQNIVAACTKNKWTSFALFGGQAHAEAQKKNFGGRLSTNIWKCEHKRYIEL